jgi:hypothetical protein
MKPLLSSMCGLMTARRFIGALGVSLIALGAHAGMVPLDDEAGESGKSGPAEVEEGIGSLPAQSVTNIEVHPEGDRVTVAIVGDGTFFPDAKLLDESRLVIDMPAVASAFRHSTVQGQHQLYLTCSNSRLFLLKPRVIKSSLSLVQKSLRGPTVKYRSRPILSMSHGRHFRSVRCCLTRDLGP